MPLMNEKKPKRGPGRPTISKPASSRFDMRITEEQRQNWSEAAVRDGYTRAGEANVSGWLKDLADEAAKP